MSASICHTWCIFMHWNQLWKFQFFRWDLIHYLCVWLPKGILIWVNAKESLILGPGLSKNWSILSPFTHPWISSKVLNFNRAIHFKCTMFTGFLWCFATNFLEQNLPNGMHQCTKDNNETETGMNCSISTFWSKTS